MTRKSKGRTSHASSIATFSGFVLLTEALASQSPTVIFRGQAVRKHLVPRIARPDDTKDSTASERRMLDELRRMGGAFLADIPDNEWDLLVAAQHFGMATRLLDWTSNPLAAMWFACADKEPGNAYIYALAVPDELLIPNKTGKGPFEQAKTRVFQPRWNNPRIVAQHGWFTAHRFSKKSRRFVPLEWNPEVSPYLTEFVIPGDGRVQMLKSLDRHGISSRTLFPDLMGLCQYLTWCHGAGK
jgi:hypothetical protein